MASCQINITGTTGEVLIKYTLGSITNELTATISDGVYIPSTATAVTYTTLSGDAIASAAGACVVITELPINYYSISFESFPISSQAPDLKIIGILLDAVEYDFSTAISYNSSWQAVASNINLLEEAISVTSGKGNFTVRETFSRSIIVKVLGAQIPWMKVKNVSENIYFYVKGVTSANAIPSGYTEFEPCESTPL